MRRTAFLTWLLWVGLVFLYIPIASMAVLSFNASRLVTVWGGFSFRWYAKLFENEAILEATLLSIRIAAISATVATVLGVMAGIALARFGPFRGRGLFQALMVAPLVMPEIIIGIAMLMLFVIMGQILGWPAQRGTLTMTLAHITLSVTYVVTVVRARLTRMDPSIEEAATDLGARPLQVLIDIVLPIIAPAMVSGWLLAFTLSLDNVVISSFTGGPGSTTLPILIWSKVKLGVTPEINALGTVIVVVVGSGAVLAAYLLNRTEQRKLRRSANLGSKQYPLL